MSADSNLVPLDQINNAIFQIRGQRIMLDADLAQLYEVETKMLVRAVKRNIERFPEDFMFQLTEEEFQNLRSQFGTSSEWGGRRYAPYAFTEQGVAMLSSVLRSETAVRVNIEIMRAFIRMRHLFAVPGEFVTQLQELSKTTQLHDGQIKAIIDILQEMMARPKVEPPKRRIGFADTDSPKETP